MCRTAFWPTSTSEYAAPMNKIPKIVFSKTLEDAGWGETPIAAIHVYRPRESAAAETIEQ